MFAKKRFIKLFIFACVAGLVPLLAQDEAVFGPADRDTAIVELVSEVGAAVPGSSFDVAVRFELDPHWHFYWKNPGDTGYPPSVVWTLPEGVTAGPLEFPVPERIPTEPFVSYGYEGVVFLHANIQVSDSVPAGSELVLKAEVDWLACEFSCLPGSASLGLKMPVVADGAGLEPGQYADEMKENRQSIPQLVAGSVEYDASGESLSVRLSWPGFEGDALDDAYFFIEQESVVDSAKTQTLTLDGKELTLELAKSEYFEANLISERVSGILYSPAGFKAAGGAKSIYFDSVDKGTVVASSENAVGADEKAQEVAASSGVGLGFGKALLFAFLGGMILNLMPCVFPVLSIKIMGFVQQSGEDKGKILKHGMMFAAGVLVSFWVLAGALIALRAGGESLGWGFQMQNPYFVGVMLIFIFVFGLSLAGLFEFGTSAIGLAGKVKGSGYASSFSSGILATAVATPCTGPFMSGALAYALSLPALGGLAIFTVLGIGMSTPYLVLSANPKLINMLPRPGAWMETFKQAMSFLMFASAVWLVSVLLEQLAAEDTISVLGGLTVLGFAAWIYGRWSVPSKAKSVRLRGQIATLLFAVMGIWWLMPSPSHLQALKDQESERIAERDRLLVDIPSGKVDKYGVEWLEYSPKLIEILKSENKRFYIDFTASWCLTCKTNKQLVFSSEEVRKEIEDGDIYMVKADWTRQNPVITQALESYGKTGIPFNVIYGTDKADPVVLPELLTPQIVIDALQQVTEG